MRTIIRFCVACLAATLLAACGGGQPPEGVNNATVARPEAKRAAPDPVDTYYDTAGTGAKAKANKFQGHTWQGNYSPR